jgi:alkyl sulfatase BDS1-like metallo-beta-lactamase superfamily hydrolase
VFEHVRRYSPHRLHTAIYTHGHVDHVFGVGAFEEEAQAKGWPKALVIAHHACPPRFDRYRLTSGYNGVINQRQFSFQHPWFPTDFRYPDRTVGDLERLEVGGVEIELHHDRGETDDHLWAWLPARRAIYTGDLFIWAAPNCGNPQKVQRYPREWAAGLRKMARLNPEILMPGHGPPILGAERVQQALSETAELLESIVEQTLRMMNDGARLNDILHSIEIPQRLLARPYLRPSYDDPLFIVRNLWRLYGGWYDGNPSNLKPARDADLAAAVAALAGSPLALAQRADRLAADGQLAVACHLVEMAMQADPANSAVHAIRAGLYKQRAAAETSLMAKGIYGAAARDSEPS